MAGRRGAGPNCGRRGATQPAMPLPFAAIRCNLAVRPRGPVPPPPPPTSSVAAARVLPGYPGYRGHHPVGSARLHSAGLASCSGARVQGRKSGQGRGGARGCGRAAQGASHMRLASCVYRGPGACGRAGPGRAGRGAGRAAHACLEKL